MVVDCAKVKKKSIVYFKKFLSKRYNEKSKDNLKQVEDGKKEKSKMLQILEKQTDVENINDYVKTYSLAFESVVEKKLKTVLSVMQKKQIEERTNVFISSIVAKYQKGRGVKQRSVTFVTLTIPSQQMHTDKVMIKTLSRYLDHLKKLKNYIVENGENSKVQIQSMENYMWRAETQENGNIHFHLLLDTYFSMVTLKNVWNSYLEKLGYYGGGNSAQIHSISNLRDVGEYVTKYMTKEPLSDAYNNDKRKAKGLPLLSKSDLKSVSDRDKYRRPIVGSSWGCSRGVMALKYPTFEEYRLEELKPLRDKMELVDLGDEVPDFIKVYKGNVMDIVRESKLIGLLKTLKGYYKFCYDSLYNVEKFMKGKVSMMQYEAEYLLHSGKLDWLKNIPEKIENLITKKDNKNGLQLGFDF